MMYVLILALSLSQHAELGKFKSWDDCNQAGIEVTTAVVKHGGATPYMAFVCKETP